MGWTIGKSMKQNPTGGKLWKRDLVPTMAIGDLLHSMSTLVLTCSRHVSQASRKLGGVLSGRKSPAVSSFLCNRPRRCRKNQLTAPATTAAAEERNRIVVDNDDDKGEDGVWQRTILLGERCQPLDFSEAIHYDSSGRRLAEPAPRRASSPFSSFAYRSEVFAAETATAEKE